MAKTRDLGILLIFCSVFFSVLHLLSVDVCSLLWLALKLVSSSCWSFFSYVSSSSFVLYECTFGNLHAAKWMENRGSIKRIREIERYQHMTSESHCIECMGYELDDIRDLFTFESEHHMHTHTHTAHRARAKKPMPAATKCVASHFRSYDCVFASFPWRKRL